MNCLFKVMRRDDPAEIRNVYAIRETDWRITELLFYFDTPILGDNWIWLNAKEFKPVSPE